VINVHDRCSRFFTGRKVFSILEWSPGNTQSGLTPLLQTSFPEALVEIQVTAAHGPGGKKSGDAGVNGGILPRMSEAVMQWTTVSRSVGHISWFILKNNTCLQEGALPGSIAQSRSVLALGHDVQGPSRISVDVEDTAVHPISAGVLVAEPSQKGVSVLCIH